MRSSLDIPRDMTVTGTFLAQYKPHLAISALTFVMCGGLLVYLLFAGSPGFYRMGNVFAFLGVLGLMTFAAMAWPIHLYVQHKRLWRAARGR